MSTSPAIWLESDGGPLVLMDRLALPHWRGSQSGSNDYEKACAIVGSVNVIDHAGHDVIVFSDDRLPLRWIPSDVSTAGYFLRWIYGESDEAVLSAAAAVTSKINQVPLTIEFRAGDLILFDAAAPGNEALNENHISIQLTPGRYDIFTQYCVPNAETSFLIHRLRQHTANRKA